MIKNIFIAMDATTATKFENEFDVVDNASDAATQATSGTFRATDMTRDDKIVYSIVTSDQGIGDFKSQMVDFVHPLMTEQNNLSVHNMNSLFNVYRLLVPTDYQSLTLATKAGGETSKKLQEIFSAPADNTKSLFEYKPSGLTNTKTTAVYDAFSISIKVDDFSLDTLDRLDAFCTFMDETATRLNGGEKADAATTEKILTEKLGTDWANFYNLAKDHIANAPYKYLGGGVAEYGVFTDDGVQTLPQAWFDQHITNDTHHVIADSFDGLYLTENRAYNAMANDGVGRSEIESLIWSSPASDASYLNQGMRMLSGESDDLLRGVITTLQENTRLFKVNVTLDNGSTAQVSVFVDTTTGFVATNSEDVESNKKAFNALWKSLPGKKSDDYTPLYNSITDLIISYGYKMDYWEKQ